MSDTDQGRSSVRLVDDQRLDIPDAAAMQQLVYAYLAQSLGSVLGFASSGSGGTPNGLPVGGCLTAPAFDTSAAPTVGIGAFTFLAFTSGGNRSGHSAEVVRYDPALGSQPYTTVDLAAYVGAGDLAWIWAKPYTVEMDTDSRRRWNTATGAEQAFSTKTRARIRVKFATGTTAAPAGGGWTPIARVSSWAGAVPTIVSFSAWDIFSFSVTPGAAADIVGASGLLSGGQLMLAYLLQRMRLGLALHLDSTGATGWGTAPTQGLTQLDARATALEEVAVIASGTCFYDTATTLLGINTNFRWTGSTFLGLRTAVGRYTLTFVTPIELPVTGVKPHVKAWLLEGGGISQAFRRIDVAPVLGGGDTQVVSLSVEVMDVNGAYAELTGGTNPIAEFHFVVFGA